MARLGTLAIRILVVAFLVIASTALAGEPRIRVQPLDMLTGSHQQVTFEFTAGAGPIDVGGGFRIELPVAYLETQPCYWDRPQTEYPAGRGYVEILPPHHGQFEIHNGGRWGGTIECALRRGSVGPEDAVTLRYAGVVQSLTWPVAVRAQWRGCGADAWQDITDAPTMKFRPLSAVTMCSVTPAEVAVDQPFRVAVVTLDRYGNRATGYRGMIHLSSTDPAADLPGAYTMSAADAGMYIFDSVRYHTPGFHKISVSDGRIEGRSNACNVQLTLGKFRRFFGETHFHTGSGTLNQRFAEAAGGGDHRGHFTTQQQAYRYVRDVMRLDFASASEHDSPQFDSRAWQASQETADAFNDPGEFTTFYGYEWTASANEGHHVILYRDEGGQVLHHRDHPTKTDLFAALTQQRRPALMIPHLMWAQPDHGMWNDVNNDYRRVGEIYSLWNNRYLLQPGDEPQRFERGMDDRWSYQYAWHHGHRIGVVGSTDNHTGRPGANNYTAHTQHTGGLAVVWAAENTREAIWEALHARRTYATTGTRILLEFTADEHFMGAAYTTDKRPSFEVKVAGTNAIRLVELVKYDGKGYHVIRAEQPNGEHCALTHQDEDFNADSMYYVRVTQVDEHYRSPWSKTTAEMAWSSPIWIEHGDADVP